MSKKMVYDIVVIGGGINGAGIAADAAGRGLKVLLCEQNDLASATSSNSSKLIHGGLRYLEHYEFKLVKQALTEREVLLKNAPHIIKPLTFRLPHQPHLRPKWMIKAGLFLYDHLAKRVSLPSSRSIKFDQNSPLNDNIKKGFEYSDGWVDDARLVILNALLAKQHGADIFPQTRCIKANRVTEQEQTLWQITLEDQDTKHHHQISAKAVVNAGGPWVEKLFSTAFNSASPKSIRLVKGSHIVVPKLYDSDEAYILQNADQRIVFVIPFEEDFSLIGTTDVDYQGDPSQVSISVDETDYLIDISNHYFKQQISSSDVITSYSGVRPLLDDDSTEAQTVTRDYTLELEDTLSIQGTNAIEDTNSIQDTESAQGASPIESIDDQANENQAAQAPLLSVFGGKITTYRKLAQRAVNKLAGYFPEHITEHNRNWTTTASLPGGDFKNIEQFSQALQNHYPWLPKKLTSRLARCYGTRVFDLLDGAIDIKQLGQHFGGNLYALEVDFLVETEWAQSAEDILWRRTKQGLYFSPAETQALTEYLTTTFESSQAS